MLTQSSVHLCCIPTANITALKTLKPKASLSLQRSKLIINLVITGKVRLFAKQTITLTFLTQLSSLEVHIDCHSLCPQSSIYLAYSYVHVLSQLTRLLWMTQKNIHQLLSHCRMHTLCLCPWFLFLHHPARSFHLGPHSL